MPMKFCPRKLGKGAVKRYMTKGPLAGYYIGCPSCGFQEMHFHVKAVFEEVATGEDTRPHRLVAAKNPLHCMYCGRTISIAGGIIMAVKHVPPA